MKPRLLDLYCGAGGAAVGYHRAGFEVIGVDIQPQPRYPFEFVQADALSILRGMDGWPNFNGEMWRPGYYTAIHASPPCQAHSALTTGTNKGRVYPQLIAPTRDLLDAIGLPYVIENVQGAPIRRDVTLCGEMFGLGVIRHRWFELGGWSMAQPEHRRHRGRVAGWRHGVLVEGPYLQVYGEGGRKGSVAQWQTAMGIDWTDDRREIAEAIPPAYAEAIGMQLMQVVRAGHSSAGADAPDRATESGLGLSDVEHAPAGAR